MTRPDLDVVQWLHHLVTFAWVTLHRPKNANWKVAVYGAEGSHAVAHYHVEGPGFRCSVDIMTSDLIIGHAPKKILAQAREWAEANRDLLLVTYKELNA